MARSVELAITAITAPRAEFLVATSRFTVEIRHEIRPELFETRDDFSHTLASARFAVVVVEPCKVTVDSRDHAIGAQRDLVADHLHEFTGYESKFRKP